MERLIRLMQEKNADKADRASTEIYAFLLGIIHSVRPVPDPLTDSRTFRSSFIPEMISYLEEHYELPLTLDDMSDRFGRTKEHICTAFKQETGLTYVDFLTRLRIFRARTLLLDHPEMKIDKVAKKCGFSGASYFGAVFKRDVGVSPSVFRLQGHQ